MRWRVIRLGLPTILGLAPRGFFIPYRYAGTLAGPGRRQPYPEIARLLQAAEPAMRALLETIDGLRQVLEAIGGLPPPAPRWNQDWFPTLDAAAAYALVRRERPRRIVEIGSGHSTRFLARAVADGGLDTSFSAIDPAPRAAIAGLDIDIERKTLAEAGAAPFRTLAAGDVLFVDSSHILMPGSDVDDILNRVLPALPAGVHVHFHDIFLPDDYPESWSWRGYNEQNAVAALIAAGGYDIVFASHYASTRLAAELARSAVARLPAKAGGMAASLWLRKR